MQTFTLFFAFAIVAIAMENFTAEFLSVKTSDADTKGLPKFQSRGEVPEFQSRGKEMKFKYGLRGVTGKEKVTITEGKDTKEVSLDKKQVLTAKTSKIIIDYTNDECCKPDRNVMFIPYDPVKISTADNPFPQNYETKWNCSACPYKSMANIEKRTDLVSRMEKADRCEEVRNTEDDFCDNCQILEEGQLCHPGKYTIEFQYKTQCKDVTFGECDIPGPLIKQTVPEIPNPRLCWKECQLATFCNFFRYNKQTQECQLMENQNRANYCNVRAAPMEKTATNCLNEDNDQTCDALVREECEYDGEVLRHYEPGQIISDDNCRIICKEWAPECKYWVFRKNERVCTTFKAATKSCTTTAGPKTPDFDICKKFL